LQSQLERVQVQLALDVTRLDAAIALAEVTAGLVDRLEVGTPLILSEGMKAISGMKSHFPDMPVIADCKIMDRGGEITQACITAGASGVVVQASAPRKTLEAVSRVAAEHGAEACVDALGVDDLEILAEKIDGVSFDYVILHRAKDEQPGGAGPPVDAALAAAARYGMPAVALAGGIDRSNVAECVSSSSVKLIIVGEAIIINPSPRSVAAEIRRVCDELRVAA
jgi:3-hexulose-6-phosphate synthase